LFLYASRAYGSGGNIFSIPDDSSGVFYFYG
jgi:hypothetical protein